MHIKISQLQYFYDPMNQEPWKQKKVPTYLYNLNTNPTHTKFNPEEPIVAMYPNHGDKDPNEICGSGELAIPIIEGLFFSGVFFLVFLYSHFIFGCP